MNNQKEKIRMELVADAEILNKLSTIKTYSNDVEATAGRVKTLREMVTDKVASMLEHDAVVEIKGQLELAQQKLRARLMQDSDYNRMMEELADESNVLKDQKQLLSDHLVAYYGMTKEQQVPVEENGDARRLIMKAKLGKEPEKYQQSLFNQEVKQ